MDITPLQFFTSNEENLTKVWQFCDMYTTYKVAHRVEYFILLPTTCIPHKTENFYKISTVPRTLIRMLFNMFTFRCNN